MGRWTAFKPRGHFSFDGKSVKKQWGRLHVGDCEALPEDPDLLEAWALFHSGRFEEAHRAGKALGDEGTTLANKSACVYAAQLEPDASNRLALFQAVSEDASKQILTQPQNPNAYYLLAYSLGRYSQGISVARALAQGLGGRIKEALENTIALQPAHADAHFALGAFHAEIIDKVGILIGGMTYGAKVETCLHMFQCGFNLFPRSAAGLMEYAIALQMLEGDAREEEARALYQQAAKLNANDAQEFLLIARAKSGLDR